MVSLLETHEKLAGWAQFMGAMLALLATYLTAFMPLRHRKKQLQKAANRLLEHGYEVLESYHRTTSKFPPVSITLRGAALSVGGIIDEIGRFPIYELDDQGSRSLARHLIAVNGNLLTTRFVLEGSADTIEGREATEEERDTIVEFLNDRLTFVKDLLAGKTMERPVWPNPELQKK